MGRRDGVGTPVRRVGGAMASRAGGDGGRHGRDPGIDAVRAVAIAGVVLGHWLVTPVMPAPGGALRTASPLAELPALAPATWLLQTVGLFFLAAGFAASARGGRRRHCGPRLQRLAGPVGGLLAALAVALCVGAVIGVPETTLRTVTTLVVSPLWFLLPFLVLTALTGPISRAVRRCGPAPVVAAGVAVVAAADLGAGLLPLTVLAAWLVPYALGVALAVGRAGGRRTHCLLLIGGAAAVVALVAAGYPASAVGVPGAGRSNLNPPSLACVALALAQAGAALLALPWLRRLRRLRVVGVANRAALPIYLWHQVALIAVSVAGTWLADGRAVPGLGTAPDGFGWLAARAAWLPAFAAVLSLLAAPHRPVSPFRLPRLRGIRSSMVPLPARPMEVIAVRDSDPPSRSRKAAAV